MRLSNGSDSNNNNIFNKIETGDNIVLSDEAGHGTRDEVTDIKIKHDPTTGEEYKIICCNEREFDGRNGLATNLQPLRYYISTVSKKK